jgi:hypothetical protein
VISPPGGQSRLSPCNPPPVAVHDQIDVAPPSQPCRITWRRVPGRAPFTPLLESWERSDHPSQAPLRAYRDQLLTLAAPALKRLEPPLALGFHVAGRADIAAGCDLENFLTPVMKALGGDAFSFVWATRGRASERSSLTFLRAADARLDTIGQASHARARLSLSPSRPEWKAALAAAVGRHDCAYRNGACRARPPIPPVAATQLGDALETGDHALGGVLGEGHRPWHPRDDRISLLVLERELRPELGWDVELDVWWAAR